jgi:uncharacterized membrane protein HdeD (DUF308 family)
MEAAGNLGSPEELAVVAELKKKSGLITGVGVAAAIAGIVCIIVPAAASVTIGLFIGWLLLIGGILQLIDALAVRDGSRTALSAIGALITLGVGIWVLTSDYHGTFTLAVILGIWFFATGLLRLISGIQSRGVPGSGVVIVNGLLSLILGGLILGDLPSSASWAIGLLVGVNLLMTGIALIMTASAVKRV